MTTVNVASFSPMIEVQLNVTFQLPQNLDANASASDLEKVVAAFAVSQEVSNVASKAADDDVQEKVESIPSVNAVEKPANEPVEKPNNEPLQAKELEGLKAAIVGGSWTIDPKVVAQLLDGETLKQVLVKALTS